jgi:hypothetical protein
MFRFLASVAVGFAIVTILLIVPGLVLSAVTDGPPKDCVVISYDGGKILDVWITKGIVTQATNGVWQFKDLQGDSITITGKIKIIEGRASSSYKEYHMEGRTK